MHLIPCINRTSSGIDMKAVVFRLQHKKQPNGFSNGPAVTNIKGRPFTANNMDGLLVDILEELFEEFPKLFPPEVNGILGIRERYHCFRI